MTATRSLALVLALVGPLTATACRDTDVADGGSTSTDATSTDATNTDAPSSDTGSSVGTSTSTADSSDAESSGTTGSPGLCADDAPDFVRPEHWSRESHCKGEAPDYARLFDDTVVQRIDITIAPADHQAQMDELAELFPAGPPTPGEVAEPSYVPVTVEHDGRTWTQVGFRYKGNSSLRTSWQQGIRKLSFRFDFDEYEADHPELDDQRFWGFAKMTFSNGFSDRSLMHDKLGADTFRDAGVPAARGAFAAVWVDFGEGPTYFGLYTMIEDPDDEMIGVQFSDRSGNLYKPENQGARLQSLITADLNPQTNEKTTDYSDVAALVTALNAPKTDAAAWRADLEAALDVDGFLQWLALNQCMENWDTYGWMTHNFYLYGDPGQSGRLVWFPWDLNESFFHRAQGPASTADSVLLDEIGADFPLIRYVLDDPTYEALYRQKLQEALDGPFAMDAVQTRAEAYHELIAPWVDGPEAIEAAPYTFLTGTNSFADSLTDPVGGLLPHVEGRRAAVIAALDG